MYSTAQIRNIVLAGHAGTGKTLLFDALLHAGGALPQVGSIERGTTASDFDPLEKERGHSIDSAISSIDHGGIHVNLIDTPGHPDFRGATLSALAAADTMALVVDAESGCTHAARRLMQHAAQRRLCRVIVVNRIDATPAHLAALLEALRDAFGPVVLPLNLPAEDGTKVVDCFGQATGDSDLGPIAEWHQRILDQVVEISESVMDHYLELGEGGLSGDELHAAFEQCLREGHLIPVCFVSARTGTGVRELLDIAEKLFPHPGEANPPPFVKGEGADAQPVAATPDPAAHVIADVFKVVHDPFMGKLGIFRVYQGTVRKDATLFIDDGRKPFRVGHLFQLRGKEHVEVAQAIPGDIAAVAKVEELHFDAVLHDSHDEDRIHLEPLAFPAPMFGLAIEAASKGQEQKLSTALHRLAEEDPAVQLQHDPETNETVLRGLSDLHLRVLLERLKARAGMEVATRLPRIAYRETVSAAAEGHHRHKKQTGGAGQFGEVFLRIEPLPRGGGFEFVDEVKGGTIPGQFLPAVEKGVRQVLKTGALAGFPLQDVRVVVYDGKHHAVDSKEIAFVTAGRKAFLDAVGKAQPQLLEPIVEMEVAVPEAAMGDVTGSLSSRRAHILATDAGREGDVVLKAEAPLSELEGFAAELKSVTSGRGRYAMEFSHYDPAPARVQQQLVAAWKPRTEED